MVDCLGSAARFGSGRNGPGRVTAGGSANDLVLGCDVVNAQVLGFLLGAPDFLGTQAGDVDARHAQEGPAEEGEHPH